MTTYDLGRVVGENGQDGDDGNGIVSIEKTGTSGLVDTYTITYTDGDTDTFTVTNGSDATVTIVSSWSATTSDSKVASEKLTKDSLDGKVSKSSTVGLLKNDGTVDTTSYSTFDGNYNSLANKPTIPSASSTTPSADTTSGSYGSGTSYARSNHTHPKSSLYAEATHSHTKSQITDFPSLSTVATSGSYSDLSNKPSYTATITSSTTGAYEIGKINVSGSSQTIYGKDTGGSSVDIVTAWESTPSDSKVASEKLTKDTLDGKLDNAISSTAITIASNDNILVTDYSDSNKVKRVANILASQVKDSTAHSNIGSSANDSQATINGDIDTALSNKVSKSSTSGLLKNDGSIDTNTYLTSSAISGMLTTSDVVDNLTSTSTTAPLSAKQGKVLNDLIGDAITYINQ